MNRFTNSEEVPPQVVAFVMSFLVLVIGCAVLVPYAKRRPTDKVPTWGEAYLGGTYVFFLLFWAYGVVPHQWLNWADNELNWRPDEFFLETYAIDVTKAAVRDIVAVGLYVGFLGVQIAFWMFWQNRAKPKATEIEVSAYGRPLVKPASGKK
ncbi:MAG TPA: hypothetical protein VGA13_00365 [Acidimicrobiales bacterium]